MLELTLVQFYYQEILQNRRSHSWKRTSEEVHYVCTKYVFKVPDIVRRCKQVELEGIPCRLVSLAAVGGLIQSVRLSA